MHMSCVWVVFPFLVNVSASKIKQKNKIVKECLLVSSDFFHVCVVVDWNMLPFKMVHICPPVASLHLKDSCPPPPTILEFYPLRSSVSSSAQLQLQICSCQSFCLDCCSHLHPHPSHLCWCLSCFLHKNISCFLQPKKAWRHYSSHQSWPIKGNFKVRFLCVWGQTPPSNHVTCWLHLCFWNIWVY